MNKVDGIVYGLNKMVAKLKAAVEHHNDESQYHAVNGANSLSLSDFHNEEARRAEAIAAKIEALVSV